MTSLTEYEWKILVRDRVRLISAVWALYACQDKEDGS
jgi:hypothetical protein